ARGRGADGMRRTAGPRGPRRDCRRHRQPVPQMTAPHPPADAGPSLSPQAGRGDKGVLPRPACGERAGVRGRFLAALLAIAPSGPALAETLPESVALLQG